MKYLIVTFLQFICITQLLYAQSSSINAAALENGSRFISTPISYVSNSERANLKNYSPDALLDQSNNVWCSQANSRFPFTFVIELAEAHSISHLVFDNRAENYAGICTKDVRVEFSLLSASEGYDEYIDYTLEPNKVNQYNVSPIQARWIRLTILSNYGNSQYTELNEFKAVGYPRHEKIKPIDISGLWETNWQLITFKQSGNTFTATYSYDKNNSTLVSGKVTNGKIERNRLSFDWQEGELIGSATLYMNEEGNQLSGKWWNSRRTDDFGLWIMHRNKPKPIINLVDEANISFDGQKIELGKKVVMNNLIFQQSKAILEAGMEEELNKLVTLLKQNPNLKVEISGHTDNVGNPDLNIKLSEDRVHTVKNYLIKNSIDQKRIKGKGYGGAQPIANNSNPETRKLNRRVEFVLY